MFKLNDQVVTSKGVGTITFIEDDVYMEVTVGGSEMSYEAPFQGVSPYLEPVEPVADGFGDINLDDCEGNDSLSTLVRMGRAWHVLATQSVRALGGSAATWAELDTRQRLNYIAVACNWGTADAAAEKIRAYRRHLEEVS